MTEQRIAKQTDANRPDITIVGLGPGGLSGVPLGTYRLLKESKRTWLRTGVHPAAEELKAGGVGFATFDELYERAEAFEEVYAGIARQICAEARQGELIYGVPGHPLVAERSVQEILNLAQELGLQVAIVPAMSFLDVLLPVLNIDPVQGFCLLDGLTLDEQPVVTSLPTVITQVYSQVVASEVKLRLMECYPDEHMITVVRAAGVPGEERREQQPLFELDRLPWVDHLTSVFVPPLASGDWAAENCEYALDSLVNVMAHLRSEGGCPWDREQTHESLKKYMIEETYEVLDAIDSGNVYKICEELGDLLLQIVFHAQIARENAYFDINDVIMEITEKMIRRHPHVFGTAEVSGSADVVVNWERIKAGEKVAKGEAGESVLDGIPLGLPALMRAEKLQSKAAKVGFDWPDYRGAWEKVLEEVQEVKEVLHQAKQALQEDKLVHLKEELGDLLFAIVNVARFFKIDAEEALVVTNNKFMRRFAYIEQQITSRGRSLKETTLEELDKIWEESKIME
ncbi:MAG: nucleoside triphosphate pyrophosphohydrolase [Clostridia bacterium]|nr:nucleoside triphosphate pyrophosphohydrolase [Clostridia bacterium]